MMDQLALLGGILLVDLVLSGDNALVIGAAAAGLPQRQRLVAVITGGGGALIARVMFAVLATELLQVPLLQAIGGVLLLVIAIKLLTGRPHGGDARQRRATVRPATPTAVDAEADVNVDKPAHLHSAMLTIMVADVTMSLDNVLAVGALARGHIPLLIIGLVLSIALLLVGSALVARLMARLPWLLDLAAIALGWTAGTMLLHDGQVGPLLLTLPAGEIITHVATIGLVLVVDVALRVWARRSVGAALPPRHTSPVH